MAYNNNANIETLVFNPVQVNTYLVYDNSGQCMVIDPAFMNDREFSAFEKIIVQKNLDPVKLVNTHCHFDHIFGVEKFRQHYPLKWEANHNDQFLVDGAPSQAAMFGLSIQPISPADIFLNEGDVVSVGSLNFEVLHIPGHSPGSICFYEREQQMVFTGDVLFFNSIGRTDLPRGDYDTLIEGIKNKLLTLPDEVVVYPGHGPATSIGYEKANNPYLR